MMFRSQMAWNLNALLLRQLHRNGVDVAAAQFKEVNKIADDEPGFADIIEAHRRRVAGEGSPKECDDVCRKVAQG